MSHQKNLFQVFDTLGVKQVRDAHADHVLGSEEECVGKGPIETEGWERFGDIVNCKAGSWEGIGQFSEKRRVEAEPSRGTVGPLSGDVLKELELGGLRASAKGREFGVLRRGGRIEGGRVDPRNPEQ